MPYLIDRLKGKNFLVTFLNFYFSFANNIVFPIMVILVCGLVDSCISATSNADFCFSQIHFNRWKSHRIVFYALLQRRAPRQTLALERSSASSSVSFCALCSLFWHRSSSSIDVANADRRHVVVTYRRSPVPAWCRAVRQSGCESTMPAPPLSSVHRRTRDQDVGRLNQRRVRWLLQLQAASRTRCRHHTTACSMTVSPTAASVRGPMQLPPPESPCAARPTGSVCRSLAGHVLACLFRRSAEVDSRFMRSIVGRRATPKNTSMRTRSVFAGRSRASTISLMDSSTKAPT
jgi:hypothetical protein